jgi:hypothetical protein
LLTTIALILRRWAAVYRSDEQEGKAKELERKAEKFWQEDVEGDD